MADDIFDKCTALELLTLCIYGEARGEGLDGMCAVGSVVMNRAHKQLSSNDGIIKQTILKPKQFSCFNEGDANRSTLENLANTFATALSTNKALKRCYWIARGILGGMLPSNVGPATHYHEMSISPYWAKSKDMTYLTRVGRHLFYLEG